VSDRPFTVPLIDGTDLTVRLQQMLTAIRHSQGAMLLSSDGITRCALGLGTEQADQLAATASGLFSLARSAGTVTGAPSAVRQVLVELDNNLLFISSAGLGTVLAVVTSREADAALVGFETQKFVASVRSFLPTPERPATR
jgi:predicted regulator of Ras-like GTPase activity (Roadblock/LC7/MglB family)